MTESSANRVGLLLCDDVNADDQGRYGNYFRMFQDGLDPHARDMELIPFRCFEDEPLPDPETFDGYVISGSRYSVYEDHPWIDRLMDFTRRCRDQERRMVGVCFGHQVLAQALGGRVEKARVGWGFGVQAARITHRQPWMNGLGELDGGRYNLVVIHQDQVVEVPPGFTTIAGNDFCPNGMITDGKGMLGIQGHPEFDKAFCAFRADFRRKMIGEDVYRTAMDSLAELELHSPTVLDWMRRFLRAET